MGSINLYKIDNEKIGLFVQCLAEKMEQKGTIEIRRTISDDEVKDFGLTLYISPPKDDKVIGWNWALAAFEEFPIEISSNPRGIILIEEDENTAYAVTLGNAFFLVDKFCDRDFGFNFARKLDYSEIKTTTLTTPNAKRNKTINTYIHYSELEFDSGESFAKLKAKVKVDKDFPLFKPSIEIGSSIRFSTEEESLEQILDLILYTENVIATQEDKCFIPVFSKIKDKDRLALLDAELLRAISEDPAQISMSELDIVGVTEIFNNNDGEFELNFRGKKKVTSTLSNEAVQEFCTENDWNYSQVALDIIVVSLHDGYPIATKRVKELIDYTNDAEHALLSKGNWYHYNDDYLNYLHDSIAEIDVEYHPEYDFSKAIHRDFIDTKYNDEKGLPEYRGKTISEVKGSLKKKYYAERAYNLLREQEDAFQNFDRHDVKVGSASLEIMDLYKDEMMCAVKIGNASSKLCYAVDQSLTSLKLYKKGMLPDIDKISTVVLWFVLKRNSHIEDESGIPQLNELDMLLLKNRLDQWKKEVRLQGFKPLIYINYSDE